MSFRKALKSFVGGRVWVLITNPPAYPRKSRFYTYADLGKRPNVETPLSERIQDEKVTSGNPERPVTGIHLL